MKKSLKTLQGKTREDLLKELKASQEALYKLRFQKTLEESVDTSQFGKTRIKIARINTLLRQQELAQSKKE